MYKSEDLVLLGFVFPKRYILAQYLVPGWFLTVFIEWMNEFNIKTSFGVDFKEVFVNDCHLEGGLHCPGHCYTSVKSVATRFFINIFRWLWEPAKMISSKIFYDSSNIESMWDLIVGITEIMSYLEDESINCRKV